MLQAGDKAPDFKLEGDDGKFYTLENFRNKLLVLYFYPKDNTSGCTTEAREFSGLKSRYEGVNAVIAGVSPDSPASHRKFREKAEINFLLLSDPDKETARAYGVYGEKKMYGKSYMGVIRSTFVIENGIVKQAWVKVKPGGHAANVWCELDG